MDSDDCLAKFNVRQSFLLYGIFVNYASQVLVVGIYTAETFVALYVILYETLKYINKLRGLFGLVSFPAPNPHAEKGLVTLKWFLGCMGAT